MGEGRRGQRGRRPQAPHVVDVWHGGWARRVAGTGLAIGGANARCPAVPRRIEWTPVAARGYTARSSCDAQRIGGFCDFVLERSRDFVSQVVPPEHATVQSYLPPFAEDAAVGPARNAAVAAVTALEAPVGKVDQAVVAWLGNANAGDLRSAQELNLTPRKPPNPRERRLSLEWWIQYSAHKFGGGGPQFQALGPGGRGSQHFLLYEVHV